MKQFTTYRKYAIKALLMFLVILSMGSCKDKEVEKQAPPEIPVIEVIQKDVPIYNEFVGQVYGEKDIPIRARVNDDEGSENQWSPAIAVAGNDNFIVTWVDCRAGDDDIFAQRFAGDGSPLGSNFKVNDDTLDYVMQYGPSVAADEYGNFVIAWDDMRNGYWGEIWAQRFSSDGTALGANFKVNYLGATVVYGAKVACKNNGDFIITWGDAEDGGIYRIRHHDYNENELTDGVSEKKGSEPDIWAQRFSDDGTAIGENFKVNDDVGTTYQQCPAIAISEGGEFIIAWEDNRNGDWDIYFQRYTWDGTAIGDNAKVEGEVYSEFQNSASVTYDTEGIFIIAWCDKRNGDYDIYAQVYFDELALGNNFRINTDNGNSLQDSPCISAGANGKFLIIWRDSRNGNDDIYGQRFWLDWYSFGVYGGNYNVTDNLDFRQKHPAVAMKDFRIFNAWQDNHNQQFGFDIWASVSNWNYWVGIEDISPDIPELELCLHQNYPNPFNSSTKISYTLNEPGFVSLNLYDRLGRKIKSLVNKFQSANTWSVDVDGSEIESGIYFYRLEVGDGNSEVKKMIHMD